MVISFFILKAGFELLRDTLSQILGERVDSKLSEEIKAEVSSIEGVLGCYDLLFHNYGPDTYLASTHIEVNESMTAKELDGLMRTIEKRILQKETNTIEMDLVIAYEEKNRHGLAEAIEQELEEKFPHYHFRITEDYDIS